MNPWGCLYLAIGFVSGLIGLAVNGTDWGDDVAEAVGYLIAWLLLWPLMILLAILYRVTGDGEE